jgi:hypothetical protein
MESWYLVCVIENQIGNESGLVAKPTIWKCIPPRSTQTSVIFYKATAGAKNSLFSLAPTEPIPTLPPPAG